MGLWIWSTHFTRMLAFDLPVPVACPPAHGSPLAFNRRSCLSPPALYVANARRAP